MEEEKSILNNLKSNYIFDEIISYIEDKNFKFKLLNYSKELQEKFNIKKNDYINKYLDYCINEDDKNKLFLTSLYYCDCKKYSEYQKTIKEYTKKYNIKKNDLEEYILNLIENRIKKESSDEIDINIYSPFLNHYVKKFLQNLSFKIDIYTINYHNLNNDASNIFKKMNESNINYKSLNIFLDDEEENNFFKKIFSKNINFINFFNSLSINYDKIEKLTCSYFNPPKKYISTNFYNSLLSSFQNKNNLIYLDLKIEGICNNIDIINEFKSLKYLYLNGFHFTQNLVINLQNLEEISIIYCRGIKIIFDEMNKNIKFLKIVASSIESSGKSIDLPNLETIILDTNLMQFNNIIDFSSFKKIEKFCGSYDYLNNMNLAFLKNLELTDIDVNKDKIKEFASIFQRIINLENLKEIKLNIRHLSPEYFNDIKGQNKYVTNLKIIFNENILVDALNILLKIFPNITEIDINSIYNSFIDIKKIEEIKMEENIKITKMNFNFDFLYIIKFNFLSFENIIELKLKFTLINLNISDINKFINIFNSNNPIKFSSLKILSLIENNNVFGSGEKDIERFLNTAINKLMPNLEDLTLKCTRLYEKYYYNQLYEKILLFNLKRIDLKLINPDSYHTYSLKELKEMFPKINFHKFERVLIERYDQKQIMEYKKDIIKINKIFNK